MLAQMYFAGHMKTPIATLALLCLAALPAAAQHNHAASTPGPGAAPAAAALTDVVDIEKIVYTGVDNYTQSDFAAATGLAPGKITMETIQKTADDLAATGQFAKVEFSMDGTTLDYKVTPPSHPLPVQFENFAWWSEIDLLRTLHTKCPLFTGTLGSEGPMEKQVQAAVTAMVSEQVGGPATVSVALTGKPNQPPSAVAYTITSPAIVIKRVSLSHGTMEMSADVAAVERQLEGQPYSHQATRQFLMEHLGEAYANQGYIDFSIKGFHASAPMRDGEKYGVMVEGDLVEGQQYHVAALNWTETPQLSKQSFDTVAAIKVGDVAARGPLDQTLKKIEENYQKAGYVNAKASATPTLDHEKATVSYTFTVEPGAAFTPSE
jgi:outer membrane protein assembly factor BamA